MKNIEEIQIVKTIYIKKVTYKEYLDIRYPKIDTSILQKKNLVINKVL